MRHRTPIDRSRASRSRIGRTTLAALGPMLLAAALCALLLVSKPHRAAACFALNPICWAESLVDTLKDIVLAVEDLAEEIIELDPGDFFSDLADVAEDLIVCDALGLGSNVSLFEIVLILSGSNTAEALFNECTDSHPIEPVVRAQLEAYFQSDLSSVRVHEECDFGGRSAITFGEHIYFARGEYGPFCDSWLCAGGKRDGLLCDPEGVATDECQPQRLCEGGDHDAEPCDPDAGDADCADGGTCTGPLEEVSCLRNANEAGAIHFSCQGGQRHGEPCDPGADPSSECPTEIFRCDGGTRDGGLCNPLGDVTIECPGGGACEPAASCQEDRICLGDLGARCTEVAPGVFFDNNRFGLLAHELTHVLQYRKKGFKDFTCEYSLECGFLNAVQGQESVECGLEQQAYVFQAMVIEDMRRDGDGVFTCPMGECDGDGGVWTGNRARAHSCSAEAQLCGLSLGTPGAPDYCAATDNCPDVANPDQADSDGDGRGDRCDVDCPGDPDPLPFEDLDQDCVSDATDNCACPPDFAVALSDCDTSNDDSLCSGGDRDGLPCDNGGDDAVVCPGGGVCQLVASVDCRRVISCVDAFANPEQADCDEDAAGDACDDDDDDDGLSDDEERGVGTDLCDPDTDDDALTDFDEVKVHGTDPLDPDTDADGLTDAEEIGLGTDPLDSDSDDDGLDDGTEPVTGMNPLDPDSDDDGIVDGRDTDFLANVIAGLPAAAFRDQDDGLRTALLTRLEAMERLVSLGRVARAVAHLADLRTRLDGCGAAPAPDDWLSCEAQAVVRPLLDLLSANLRET